MNKAMKNNYSLLLLILFSLFLLSACGDRFGPSDEKAELDFKESINKQYQSVLQVKSFEVNHSHSLSEDRVDMDVTIVLQRDPTVEEKINNYRDPFGGYSSHPLKRIWRKTQRLNMGKDIYLTLHYKLSNNTLWTYQSFSARKL